MADERPLRKIAEAFKELEAAVNSPAADVEVAPFSHACSLVSPLFGCLGIAFKFAEIDYVAKVRNFIVPFFFSCLVAEKIAETCSNQSLKISASIGSVSGL